MDFASFSMALRALMIWPLWCWVWRRYCMKKSPLLTRISPSPRKLGKNLIKKPDSLGHTKLSTFSPLVVAGAKVYRFLRGSIFRRPIFS